MTVKEFTDKLEEVFKMANDIEGISEISWNLKYRGNDAAVDEMREGIYSAMNKVGMHNIC